MKQILYEWRKLIGDRAVLLVMLLVITATLGFQWKSSLGNISKYDRKTFEAVLAEIEDMPQSEVLEWLKAEQDWQRVQLYAAYGETEEVMELIESAERSDELKERLEKEGAGDAAYDAGRAAVINELEARAECAAKYPEFLAYVQHQADSMQGISLFYESNAFSERNIKETARVYKRLEGLTAEIDFSNAVLAWSDSTLPDWLIFIAIILLGWQVFRRERENGQCQLIFSTRNGHLSTGIGKIIAYLVGVALLAAAVYGVKILLAIAMYGTGNMDAPLISVSDFRNCPFAVSIRQYMLLWLLIKILASATCGAFAMLLFCMHMRFAAAAGIYLIAMIAQYAAYLRIDSSSSWNVLKYVNMCAAMDAKGWFASYRNMNIFSYPISAVSGRLAAMAISLAIFPVLSCIVFCKGCREKSSGRVRTLGLHQPGIAVRLKVCTAEKSRLFMHEAYKLYVLGGMLVIAPALALLSARLTESAVLHSRTTDQSVYDYYIERLEGEYTDEKEQYIREEERILILQDDEALQMQQALENGSISAEEYDEWSLYRNLLINTRTEGFKRILEQDAAVKAAVLRGENAGFVNTDKLALLFNDDKKQTIMSLLLMAAQILGTSFLFGAEEKGQIMPLLESTKYGRRPLCISKLIHAVLMSAALYLLIYIPYYALVWITVEELPLELELKGVIGYESFELGLSIGEAFTAVISLRLAAAISSAILISETAWLAKRTSTAGVISALLFMVP